ncbi:MAG: tetratricopeptide repeat protein [Pseudodesulfovibrio sp.]|uniref:tetratricopeptide repeat protein n=1 Tax=Pseudodesulfovibrio sp. TaxID=2035812 RepID=UPI003D10C1D5
MSIFSKLVKPYRRGEKHFERGRAAESRGDFGKAREYFLEGAAAFDEHFEAEPVTGAGVRPSHLVMAGVCYVRIGRDEDGLRVLRECLSRKEIPDAFLNAGYAAAQLGRADEAAELWSGYPSWAGQRVVERALKEQVRLIRSGGTDLGAACEAVARAVQEQDRTNARDRNFREAGRRTSEFRQGY